MVNTVPIDVYITVTSARKVVEASPLRADRYPLGLPLARLSSDPERILNTDEAVGSRGEV